jgi:cytochrome c-type biogenesis protein CcmF
MLANLGFFAQLIAFLCCLYAATAAIVAMQRRHLPLLASARTAALITFPLLTLACGIVIWLLVTNTFNVDYVTRVTSLAMPTYLKVTALWGGQAGSLLFWSWLMSGFAAAAMLRKWERDRAFMPWVIVVLMITLGFFISLTVFFENPFARLWRVPASGEIFSGMLQPAGGLPFIPVDGRGLNPLLRHPGMIIHPPMLYIGFVGFVVPYAFAIAALATRRADDAWIRTTRRWTLVGWLFLSLGLILGGRWAYDVLGWGGYWGWDPVENAAFMPWLTGTAFLHSVMIQEKRGMLKKWNMVLIILTYSLIIFGTFLTRSGVLSSVHAFAQSAIGPMFFGFISLTFIASLVLLFRSWDSLRSEHQLDRLLSRETAFLLNNLLFMCLTGTVFLGTVFPMVTELLQSLGAAVPVVGQVLPAQTMSVGPDWYNTVTGPQFALLVLLMGVAPLVAWRQASARQLGRLLLAPFAAAVALVVVLALLGYTNPGALLGFGLSAFVAFTTLLEFWRGTRARQRSTGENAFAALTNLMARNRRRYGGYVIHLGVVLMAIGVVGSTFYQRETQARVRPGEQITLGRYIVTFEGLTEFNTIDDRHVARATVRVYRDGQYVGQLNPRRDFYFSTGDPMTIPGVRSTVEDDLYILLVTWEPIAADGATLKVYVNPLVNWIWAGGGVFILGTLVAAWPTPAETRRRVMRAVPAGPAARASRTP